MENPTSCGTLWLCKALIGLWKLIDQGQEKTNSWQEQTENTGRKKVELERDSSQLPREQEILEDR